MKPGDEICSIDANIILRYLLNDNPDLYNKAREIMLGVESGQTVVKCDPVNLAEVV